MAEFVTCRLQCPLCGAEFSADEIHGAVSSGRDTDFRPHFEGPSPLLTHIHSCPGCCYSGYREAFESEPSDEDELIEEPVESPVALARPSVSLPEEHDADDLRRYTRSGELSQGLPGASAEPFGAMRYLFAARIHEFLNEDDPLGAGHYYLRAAWAARATNEPGLERVALRELLLNLRDVLEQGRPAEYEKVRLQYLAAETARRLGDFGRAIELFAVVEQEADQDEDEGLLLAQLARRQQRLAASKSTVNATIPADLPGRWRRGGEGLDDEDLYDDDGSGGPSSLN